jgi:hypothetical protein
MSEKNELAVKVSQDIEMKLDKNDVVSYHIAVLEEELDAKKETLTKERKAAEQRSGELSKLISTEGTDLVAKEYKSKLENIEKAFRDIGISGVSAEIQSVETSHDKVRGKARISIGNNSSYGSIERTFDLPAINVSDSIRQAIGDQRVVLDDLAKLSREIGEVSMKLNNMSKLERQAKRKVVEAILNGKGNTGDGLLLIEGATKKGE